MKVRTIETVNINLYPVNLEEKLGISCGGVLLKCPPDWNQFPASERVPLLNNSRELAFHDINGDFNLRSTFYEVEEKNVLKTASI